MKKTISLYAALATIMAAPTISHAQAPQYPQYASGTAGRPGTTYVALKLGMISPKHDDVSAYDNGFALDGAVGYRLNPNVALEASLGRFSFGLEQSGEVWDGFGWVPATYKNTVVGYPLLGTARFILPVDAVEVYGLAGLGLYFMSVKEELNAQGYGTETTSDSNTGFGVHLGGGLSFRVSPRAVLGAELKYVIGSVKLYDVTSHFDSLLFGAFLGYQL